ncbi:T9SS type A sorting domain-containing protein [Flavobacteriaceae bacterium 144Ye]|nr:T9SS type A sorting domain-containing protein [Flavobacteriaceae bacterium 144Ye]
MRHLLYNTNVFGFSIYGLDGKQLVRSSLNVIIKSIDISQLNKGIYVLNLNKNKNSESVKIVKY